MKKLATTLAAVMVLSPSVIDASTILKIEDEETLLEGYQTEYEFDFEPLTLLEETYDGECLIRTFQYQDSGRLTLRFIELPPSITKQVETNDENAVAKVTALLAQYYLHEEIDNIPSLNELLLAYTPDRPFNKLSVSKEYEHTFSDNLKYVLDAIENNEQKIVVKQSNSKNTENTDEESVAGNVETNLDNVDEVTEKENNTDNSTSNIIEISKEEIEMLTTNPYGKNSHPYKTKELLLNATSELYEELRIKWYEKTSTYFFIGAAILLTGLLTFIYKRDFKPKKNNPSGE